MSTSKRKSVYITTTLPYVNSDPHIGFALEIIHADILARYFRLAGSDVFFNTGSDEHGLKIYRKAKEEGKDPKNYVDEYAEKFRNLKEPLGLSEDIHFMRTSSAGHKKAAQEFWRRCDAAEDIYKKFYKIKYCVGCELEKTDSELVESRCPIHPNLELEIIEEENYFFRFSQYALKLLELYEARPDFVAPSSRFNEIKAFASRGLEDFSISRLKSKMPWGIPVPGDDAHVMYVWFDALVSYISAIGWPDDEASFKKWWVLSGGVIQFAGKDQIRMQAAMWQAMLMSAGLTPSKQIVIHGFITSGGQKISKSLGNSVDPFTIAKEYGTDALRYYLARHVNFFEDSDFTLEKFKEAYNANLANGLGNLLSRVLKMSSAHNVQMNSSDKKDDEKYEAIRQTYDCFLSQYEIGKACDEVWKMIQNADKRIQETQPFKLIKTNRARGESEIRFLLQELFRIGEMLAPILPETKEKIHHALAKNKMPDSPLFPRKD